MNKILLTKENFGDYMVFIYQKIITNGNLEIKITEKNNIEKEISLKEYIKSGEVDKEENISGVFLDGESLILDLNKYKNYDS